ncbi:legumain-like [Brevipalpus obovatus]|uniref:legumain-like n=1 Tax=Brevipalpus obovatus TaxID=246614 RepID=UPI003D9DE5C2
MYDDMAHSPENPHQGKLFNQPNGSDVYHGVNKDYTGDNVTAENFKEVLLGDPGLKAQGKKVLESGPDDNVSIYFSDHGCPMVICFPNHDFLFASELIPTLKQMHEKKMYHKLLFYLESCESGYMFDGLLPNNISIYATTAASPNEEGWMCFCNVPEQTCLGTQYGVNWVIDSDIGKDFHGETVPQQFLIVKNETNLSTAHEYGDLSIGDMPLSAFFGPVDPPSKPNPIKKCDDPTKMREVPLHLMKQKVARASADDKPKLQAKLDHMMEAREFAYQAIREVVQHLCSKGHCQFSEEILDQMKGRVTRHECAEKLVRTLNLHCFNVSRNPYISEYLKAMVNIAEGLPARNLDAKCSEVAEDLKKACEEKIPAYNSGQIL